MSLRVREKGVPQRKFAKEEIKTQPEKALWAYSIEEAWEGRKSPSSDRWPFDGVPERDYSGCRHERGREMLPIPRGMSVYAGEKLGGRGVSWGKESCGKSHVRLSKRRRRTRGLKKGGGTSFL